MSKKSKHVIAWYCKSVIAYITMMPKVAGTSKGTERKLQSHFTELSLQTSQKLA